MTDYQFQERIDDYLQQKMNSSERESFEADVHQDMELRDETELTYRVQRALICRQQKLDSINNWERKRKYGVVRSVSALSIAASILALFVFIIPSNMGNSSQTEFLAQANNQKIENAVEEQRDMELSKVQTSIDKGNDSEALNTIDAILDDKDMPSLSNIAAEHIAASYDGSAEDYRKVVKSNESYELNWMKIQLLLKAGQNEEAKDILKEFVTVEGIHKTEADSLLNSFKLNI